MGTEIVAYCAQPLVDTDGDYVDPTQRVVLEEKAKESFKPKPRKMNKISDIPPGLPRKRSQSIDYGASEHHQHRKRTRSKKREKKESKSLRKYKANKSKRRRRSTYHDVSDDELYAMEKELHQKQTAIQLLRKQNELLRKQNEQFLSQYGSYFASNSNSSKGSEKKPNSSPRSPSEISTSNEYATVGSLVITMEMEKEEAINIDTTTLQDSNVNSNETTASLTPAPCSPMIFLTNSQTQTILSYDAMQ